MSATFTFLRQGASVRLVGICVALDPEQTSAVLTTSEVKRMPLARWQTAARAAAMAEFRLQTDSREVLIEEQAQALGVIATALENRPNDGLPHTRKAKSLARLSRVAQMYRENLRLGLADPVAEIARRFEVKPSTASVWVHRARKAGLLGPAVGTKAGEALPGSPHEIAEGPPTPEGKVVKVKPGVLDERQASPARTPATNPRSGSASAKRPRQKR